MNVKRARYGRRGRGKVATAISATALLAVPMAVEAAHWPAFGGDGGHSGNQPVDSVRMPTAFTWTAQDAGTVRNSIITTAGPDTASQLLAYGTTTVAGGTNNDRADVHLRKLEDGTPTIAASARDVDDGSDDPNAFGTTGAGVSFVDSSSSEGPGQLYVVHNDTNRPAKTPHSCTFDDDRSSSLNDISIARFDEASGTKKEDVAVGPAEGNDIPEVCEKSGQVSDGYTIESSPVITPPLNDSGDRWIFFTARHATASPRLFGIRIENAGSPDAVVHADTPQIRDVPGANTLASPTLVHLDNPDALQGGSPLYVAVPVDGAGDGVADIRTFLVGDIGDANEDGPAAAGFSGVPQTISVPVTAGGLMPGQPGSGVQKAPALYVAFDNGDSTTTVRKFVQNGHSATLTQDPATTPTPVEGSPAPALALSVLATPSGEREGRAVLTTSANLFILDSETATPVERLADAGESLGAGDAFARNVPLVSGDFVLVTNDDGTQAILRLSDAEPVGGSNFEQNASNQGADFALGQPSYSRGFAQYLTDRGVFVYRTNVNQAPTAAFTASPNPAQAGQTVSFDAGRSSDSDGTVVKHEWDLDANGSYETNTGQTPTATAAYGSPGTYTVGLRVTDNDGATGEASVDVVVNDAAPPANQPPSASFAASPNPVNTGETVAFDASGSKDPEGRIASYQWDFDGNGTFETNTGTTATVSRVYTEAGVYNVRLRVTDAEGASADTVRQVTVIGRAALEPCSPVRCRPGLAFKVRPRRDTTVPIRFTFSGRVILPKKVKRTDGCRGRVSVQTKVGRKTISTRRTKVRRDCTWKRRVTFTLPRRFRNASKLRFVPRFHGNDVLTPRRGKVKTARIR